MISRSEQLFKKNCSYRHARKVFVLVGSIISCADQGIIESTGTENLAKELKLAKLLRESKSTPVLCNKKISAGLSHMSVMCFERFAVG